MTLTTLSLIVYGGSVAVGVVFAKAISFTISEPLEKYVNSNVLGAWIAVFVTIIFVLFLFMIVDKTYDKMNLKENTKEIKRPSFMPIIE